MEWTQFQSGHGHLKEFESSVKESPSKTSTNLEPLLIAQVATQSRTSNGHKLIQIIAGCELKNAPEQLHKEQKDWIEKSEVVSEALADE